MLEEKVYIVAGGGNGLGRFASEHHADRGARVVDTDLGTSVHGERAAPTASETVASDIREAGGDAIAHHGDVADTDRAAELIETTVTDRNDRN